MTPLIRSNILKNYLSVKLRYVKKINILNTESDDKIMDSKYDKIFSLLIGAYFIGSLLIITTAEPTDTKESMQSADTVKNYSPNKTLIDNKFDVNLPEGYNGSGPTPIYDGSSRYYFNEHNNTKKYDCSTDADGCVPFQPNKTYLECILNYGPGYPPMNEYCDTTNKTNTVSMKTDNRINHVTAPITKEDYNVLKARDFLNEDLELRYPRDLMFLNEDRYLVTTLDGEIHDIKNGNSVEYKVDVLEEGPKESGLEDDHYTGMLGVVKHPNFSENNIIYLNYAYKQVPEENVTLNKVSKFRIDRDEQEIEELETVIDGIPGRLYYQGGAMIFSQDKNHLYITTGSADYERAQDNSYLGGKILRIYPNGSIPESNPYGNAVYAKGLRNPQGIDFNPETGNMVIAQHGPFRRDNIAKIGKGTNMGWPEQCKKSHPNADVGEEVLCTQTWTMAPSGITFVDDENHPWYNNLYIAGLRSRQVHKIGFDGGRATGNEVFWFNGFRSEPYTNSWNRIRDVEYNNGDLWVMHAHGSITRLSPTIPDMISSAIS